MYYLWHAALHEKTPIYIFFCPSLGIVAHCSLLHSINNVKGWLYIIPEPTQDITVGILGMLGKIVQGMDNLIKGESPGQPASLNL